MAKLCIPSEEELKSTPYYFGQKSVIFLPKQWELCFADEFEIASVGGFGCIAPDTLIFDPVKGVLEPIDSLSTSGHVLAWSPDGPQIARRSASFCKGSAMLYRVNTTCGEIVVTEDHRFLTEDGWQRLGSLRTGQSLLEFDAFRLPSILERAQSVRALNDRRLNRTLQDSPVDCPIHSHSHDEPLRISEDAVRVSARQHGDAPKRSHDVRRAEESFDSDSCGCEHLRDKKDSSVVEFLQHRGREGACLNFSALCGPSHCYSRLFCQSQGMSSALDTAESRDLSQFPVSRNSRGERQVYPYPPMLTRIISIESVGFGEFYDLHVPTFENYWAAGMWHHNSSKTFGGICRATRLLAWYPGNLGLIGRYASTDLAGTTRKDCLDFWEEANLLEDFTEKHRKYKVPTATVRCVDPFTQKILPGKYSEALFLHFDDPAHTHGHHAGFGWIDEANQCTEEARRELISRMRRPGFAGKYSLWYTSNTNKGYDFLYQNFVNPEAMAELKAKKPAAFASRRFIHGTTWENRANLAPDYIENMENSYSEKMIRVLLGASYEAFEGQMYEEWSEELHCINTKECFPLGIPTEWNRLFALDPGGSDPWAWEFAAVDPWGNVIMFDEIYGPGTRVAPFAAKAKPKIDAYPNWQAKVIDSENKIVDGELREHGIQCTNAQKLNKIGDANSSFFRLCGYLHPNPQNGFPPWHPKHRQKGSPRFFVTEKCPALRKEFPQQRWKQERSTGRFLNEAAEHVPNHGCDCCLYIIRELPHPTKLPKGMLADLPAEISKMGKIMNFERRQREEQKKRDLWNVHMGNGRRRGVSRFTQFSGGMPR